MKRLSIKNIIYYVGMITITLFFISLVTHPTHSSQASFSLPLDSGGIESIEMIQYKEGGVEKRLITASESIQEIYTYWSRVKIGHETSERCDDNTTVYKFVYKIGDVISVEKECDNYIQDGKSYIIIEPSK